MLRFDQFKKDIKVKFSDLPPMVPLSSNVWRFDEAFYVWFTHEKTTYRINLPTGFITDFASIPRALWWLVQKWDYKYTPACLPHDLGYEKLGKLTLWRPFNGVYTPLTAKLSRKALDDLMYYGMVARGVPAWKRALIYSGVRVGGGFAWKKHEKRSKKIIPRPVALSHRIRG